MSDNPNLRKNGGDGTFVGNALRTIAGVTPDILNIVGTLTGAEGFNKLSDAIRGSSSISPEDKDVLLKELEKDIVVEQEISKREVEISNMKKSIFFDNQQFSDKIRKAKAKVLRTQSKIMDGIKKRLEVRMSPVWKAPTIIEFRETTPPIDEAKVARSQNINKEILSNTSNI